MVAAIGHQALKLLGHPMELMGFAWDFAASLLGQIARRRFRFREIVAQTFEIGVGSSTVVLFCLGVVSLILVLEFSFHMKLVLRQDSLVPAFSTVLLVRELGPVVTALLLVSRVGAGIAAEIATMKITDQLDAMRLLSMDPIDYLVVPRWIACWVATVSLAVLSLGVGLLGGATISALQLGYTMDEYFNTMFTFCRYGDLWGCVIKASVFGNIIPLVACYYGFRASPGSEGVGMAATSAVVEASILVIFADFVVTYLMYSL